MLDSEIELVGGFEGVMGQRFHGEDGVRRFCDEWFTAFSTMRVEIERLLQAGERVVVLTELTATGSGSDAPVELLGAAIYSFKDDKINSIDFYYDRPAALEAAGLADQ